MKRVRDVRLVERRFSSARPLAALARACPEAGGIASYFGKVRREGVAALELQHYLPLTLPHMEVLADSAAERFRLDGIVVWHRVGRIPPGDAIVLAAAASRHRSDALSAVAYLMDHLKSAAWLWKRELRAGEWTWIEPRAEDHAALARWRD
jgi:molybdopterin synthase catalytic subunit